MAAASIPTTSGIETNSVKNTHEENARHPTVEELLIQIENHLYRNIEHRASLLIAVWSCLAGRVGYFRNMEKVFHMLYRESAMTIFCGHWPRVDLLFKRGLSRAMIHFSHSMGHFIKGAEGMCSALVMATYDPWGDPVIHKLLSKEHIEQNLVDDFIKSEPFELLVIRVECLVNARFEDAAIRLCRCCLKSHLFHKNEEDEEDGMRDNWKWTFMEWLLRLLFRKGRLNDLVAESGACSCHDGVRLIYRTRNSPLDDSEPLTETLINLFLVRDLLFQSNYCCTSELMSLWCDFQVRKQRSAAEIQDAAHKLLVGHASSSAQFYLFVDILWGKFGPSLLPLYIEMYVRGLTSDLNYLEAARQTDNKEYVIEVENHMAAMYFKLSSMFQNINKEIALECMLSSFSLDPTKERLDWIKKLSLQISKEKALKLAAVKNEACKHKLCSKTGCSYPHPVIPKKKSVIMCDQAIQVGDDSFENEESQTVLNCNNTGTVDDSTVSNTVQNDDVDKCVDDKSLVICNSTENEVNEKQIVEQNCHVNSCVNDLNSKNYVSSQEKSQPSENTDKNTEPESSPEVKNSDIKDMNCKVNDANLVNNGDVSKCENFYNNELSDTNYVPHNGEINEVTNESEETILDNCKNSKEDNDHETILNTTKEEMPEHSVTKNFKIHQDNESHNEINLNNHNISENGFASNSETENSMPLMFSKIKSKHHEQNDLSINCNDDKERANSNICINGCDEQKDSSLSDEAVTDLPSNPCEKTNDTVKEEEISLVCNNEEVKIVDSSCNNNNNTCTAVSVCESVENQNSESQVSNPRVNCDSLLKEECRQNDILDVPEPSLTVAEEYEIKSKHPFTHLVLDSKISGLTEELLSDFVIVLESLRNRQLKSSCKWSQIKHLCEDYLENVTNSRYMMLNMQINGSVDSEADSVSDVTACGFKEFESHQSDDSVVEDHYADKSHVFKRFMHTDKNTEMATYVNLSDIHCPQIPLEKLFYTEHSSSHLAHKKRHKKHRNHDKNPEKVVLRKLRHGSRADHDLLKRKKRKKRRGKRAKNHVKKHHFTHGKTNKDCLKNKKKKHKLKKKKEERNSGFISGDYCSDFSSAELMRLVKEHSHSYSKLPATTSKHPRSMGSSSDEPTRKKRKVTFDKKKQKAGKYHDKHKHQKSKSSKRKKKLTAVDSCPNAVKNITDHALHGKLDAVNDYSRIVQYSSVKKMEAVQIRQRSVALNLSEVSKVRQEQDNPSTLVGPCTSNSQLQHLVQQNFESSEDIMKMQLLMAQQQPDVMPICTTNNFLPSANNQAVLKYVCSKMTSHLLSVAQSSVASDSEGSKSPMPSPMPTHSCRTYQTQNTKIQPQNIASNVKHVIIERGGVPYKLSSCNTSLGGTIIPVSSFSSAATSDSRNLVGTVITGGMTYPATATSPQVTTFTIPMTHNTPGSKLVASKIVIPINQCGNIRTATPTPIALPEPDTRTLASTSSTPPLSGVIIVKNGNNTQIISGVQQPSTVLPCLSTGRVPTPIYRSRPSTITRTVPKIIKQAAKKLIQPIARKPIVKAALGPKLPTSSNSEVLNDPVVSASLLACKEPEVNKLETSTSVSNVFKDTSNTITSVKDSLVCEDSEIPKETKSPSADTTSTSVDENTSQNCGKTMSSNQTSIVSDDKVELPADVSPPVTATSLSSPVKDVLSDTSVSAKQTIILDSPKEKAVSSPKTVHDDSNSLVDDNETPKETPVESMDITEEKDSAMSETSESISTSNKILDTTSEGAVEEEKPPSPVCLDEKEDAEKSPIIVDKPDSPKNDSENTIGSHASVAVEENKSVSPVAENNDMPLKILPAERTDNSAIKPVNLTTTDQEKQLQPINDAETSSGKASPKAVSQNKSEGGSQTSEAPTRSFTSISDAVRFSLMDMDDATDSVENQVVLQAFQTSHASSPSSPAYAASESGEERNSASPSSAVMLAAPQSTRTTELNVTRVAQRFEPTVHCSQAEKFTECQSTVSRTTSWILEDSITEASPSVTVQKSPDVDSCGENKDDDKPKKKRKKKERGDNDITHKFWCQICSKGFFSAYNLRRHCRNVHKMDLPKGTSDVPFANSSQCLPHVQQADTTTSETSSSRLSYGNVQTSCVSPNKGSEYSLMSPSHETKNQEFSVKSGQHVPQIQSAEFQMQTPTRMTSQSSSTHISPVTPPKDFRLGTPTSSVSATPISPNKMSPVKSSPQSKFQRLPTGSQVPQMAKISQMQQIALCGQQALQQQRQIGQLQSPGLIQPLPSVACQAQQMQASQCPHFQANKQIVQQRIGQLQLMHHVAQLPSVPHATHGIQKPTQSQSFKKCSTNQSASKISESEQMQQAAQLAQNQQLLANQQMQKLIQIRQNAIAASGIASQLSLANAIPSVPGSPVKGATQCFQSQLAAARQAAVVGQIPTAQRAQGTSYNLPSHDASSHQFFSPAVQPSQDQASCPHSSFSAQNMSEFNANAPSYPAIRLSSEANDGLEDLEQFLLENMPWSGDQSSAHGLSQQSGNRPSSADSLTLSIPSQASTSSQNRAVAASKGKASISRPKPRKPVASPCSKNLLGNLGRGVKKKPCSKKTSKASDTECTASKSDLFPQSNLAQPPHELKQCNKDAIGNIANYSKQQTVKNSSVGMLNETDSSDSVQCINVTHNTPSKNAAVGINFNIFSPVGLCSTDKNTDLMCNPASCKETYDGQRKNSFLDHSNLAGTSNLDQNKNSVHMNPCETVNPINMGSAFNPAGKSSATTMKPFCPTVATPYGITNETPNPQDIFLGQRNSETSDSNNRDPINSSDFSSQANLSANNSMAMNTSEVMPGKHLSERNLFLGGNSKDSDEKSESTIVKEIIKEDTTAAVSINDNSSVDSLLEAKENTPCSSEVQPEEIQEKHTSGSEIDEKVATNDNISSENDSNNNELISDGNNSHVDKFEKSHNSPNNITLLDKLVTPESNSEENKLKIERNKGYSDTNTHDANTDCTINENGKENQTLLANVDRPKSDSVTDSSNTVLKHNTEENSIIPKVIDHDKHSSHEDTISNDENHLPKKTDLENIVTDIGLNRIALRVRKPQDDSNKLIENDKNVPYFVSEKDDIKNPVIRKSSKKKKAKQENRKNENIISDTKLSYKLDSDTKIQKSGLLNNVNKEKDLNRSLCMITSCYDGIKNNKSVESEGNGFCLDEKQLEDGSIDGIPAARLRLRDTPKTSVKRVCPCCVDAKMPKKCRANGGGNIAKLINSKVSNSLKSKSTLKTRNTTNGHNGKINTRSSERLRSRNNAVS